jgi:superfamily II DNA/RNA helicase
LPNLQRTPKRDNIMTTFAELGVPARMAEALAAAGMSEAFAVQAITLHDALAGRDLCGRAPTGSGKTLGFGIPLMARVSQATPNRPTGLVLVPTRELAEQVQRAFVPLGRAQWRFVQAVYGGSPMAAQIHSLKKGASVVVATPGRLLDIIERGHCDLSGVEVCVIDEADRMADLGFMPDVRKILDMTPATRQTMLWSATLDGDVNDLIHEYLRDPAMHDLVDEIDNGNVEHRFVVTPAMSRIDATVELLKTHGPTIVFVKTRFGVDDVTAALMNAGITAGSLHGARTQQARQRTLEDFKRGKVQALVATDVAARGIHVDNVELVVHYDLPDTGKDYKHRSGRTGRAGHDGHVVAFVPPSRQRVAQKLLEDVDVEVVWDQGRRPEPGERPKYEQVRGDRPAYQRDGARPSRDDRGSSARPYRRDDRSGPTRDDRTAAPRPFRGAGARPAAARSGAPARQRPADPTDRHTSPAERHQPNVTSRTSPGGDETSIAGPTTKVATLDGGSDQLGKSLRGACERRHTQRCQRLRCRVIERGGTLVAERQQSDAADARACHRCHSGDVVATWRALVQIADEHQHGFVRPVDEGLAVGHGAAEVGPTTQLHPEQHIDRIVEHLGQVDDGRVERDQPGS